MPQIRPLLNARGKKFSAPQKTLLFAEDIAQMKSLLYNYCVQLEAVAVLNEIMFKVKSLIAQPNFIPYPPAPSAISDATVLFLHQIVLPFGFDLNSFILNLDADYGGQNVQFAIYSLDGQTKFFDEVIEIPSGGGATVFNLPTTISLPPGIYYFALTPPDGDSFSPYCYQDLGLEMNATGESVERGYLSITAGVLPDTFDPTTITPDFAHAPALRLIS